MNSSIPEKYLRQEYEFEDDYILRIYSYKDEDNLRWEELAEIYNYVLHSDKDESTYRKRIKKLLGALNCVTEDLSAEQEDTKDDIRDVIRQLKVERIKLSDERTQNNAHLRLIARNETIRDIAIEAAQIVGGEKKLLSGGYTVDETNGSFDNPVALLCLSDWHFGIVCDNWLNKFNEDIAKNRINDVLEQTLFWKRLYGFNELYLCNLGDLIAGRIHYTIRLESRIDVITQVIKVSEILAEFIATLARNGVKVHYAQCDDNHSRVEPDKTKHLALETLTRSTKWYLQERFKGFEDVVDFVDNKFDDDIITINVNGFRVAGAHGHHDKPNSVVETISLLTEQKYDLILAAHLHHFMADERLNTLVINNGSLMGVDSYAKNLRVSSTPSQNLIICTNNDVTKGVHRLVLSAE